MNSGKRLALSIAGEADANETIGRPKSPDKRARGTVHRLPPVPITAFQPEKPARKAWVAYAHCPSGKSKAEMLIRALHPPSPAKLGTNRASRSLKCLAASSAAATAWPFFAGASGVTRPSSRARVPKGSASVTRSSRRAAVREAAASGGCMVGVSPGTQELSTGRARARVVVAFRARGRERASRSQARTAAKRAHVAREGNREEN